MGRPRHTAEQIIGKLREAEVALAKGHTVAVVCRTLGVTEQTYDRWRTEYGGLKVEQAKRLKELARENVRLKRAVADLTLDKLILKEAAEGNVSAQHGGASAWPWYAGSWASRNGERVTCWASLVRRSGIGAARRRTNWR